MPKPTRIWALPPILGSGTGRIPWICIQLSDGRNEGLAGLARQPYNAATMLARFDLALGDICYRVTSGAASGEARIAVERQSRAGRNPAVLRLGRDARSLSALTEFPPEVSDVLADAGFWGRLVGADAAQLAGIAERISQEQARRSPSSASLASILAQQFLLLAARAWTARSNAQSDKNGPAERAAWQEPRGVWSVQDALCYLDSHYAEAMSLNFFLSRCALNSSDFSRRFKAAAGHPLFEYLNRIRIRRACSLLKDSRLPIIEISAAVGYNSLSFFNRYFKRIMGSSPRAFRSSSG